MSPAETILQAARAWLKAWAHPDGTALTDKQVIASDAGGPRPPLPYLAVKVTSPGRASYTDEPANTLVEVLTVVTGGVLDDLYEVDVDGTTVSYTWVADDTDALVASGLAAAIAAEAPSATVSRRGLVILVEGATLSAPTVPLTLENDVPAIAVSGRRVATVSVHGFGSETEEWLEEAALALAQESVTDVMVTAGCPRLGFVPRGAINNDTLPLDTSMAPRFLREFDVTYVTVGRTIEQIPLATGVVAQTFSADGQTDRAVTITVAFQ